MSGKEARAAPVVRRRARGSAEAVKVVARKESKYASKAVNALLARVKTLGAAHPGLDLMFFARSVTDRRPLGTFSGPSLVTNPEFNNNMFTLIKQCFEQLELGRPVTAFETLVSANRDRGAKRPRLVSKRSSRPDAGGGEAEAEPSSGGERLEPDAAQHRAPPRSAVDPPGGGTAGALNPAPAGDAGEDSAVQDSGADAATADAAAVGGASDAAAAAAAAAVAAAAAEAAVKAKRARDKWWKDVGLKLTDAGERLLAAKEGRSGAWRLMPGVEVKHADETYKQLARVLKTNLVIGEKHRIGRITTVANQLLKAISQAVQVQPARPAARAPGGLGRDAAADVAGTGGDAAGASAGVEGATNRRAAKKKAAPEPKKKRAPLLGSDLEDSYVAELRAERAREAELVEELPEVFTSKRKRKPTMHPDYVE